MVLVNKNTIQTPSSSTSRIGSTTLRFIPAPRVYIGAPDYSNPANVVFGRSNGSTLYPFIDMGVVEGSAKVSISRTTVPMFAGVDKLHVAECTTSIKAEVSFSLSQLDDVVMEGISGIAPNTFSTGVYSNYLLGAPNLHPVSLLLVVQNKLDGKEMQLYNPAALLSFSYSDSMSLDVKGILPSFIGNTSPAQQLLSISLLSGNVAGYGWLPYGQIYGT